MSDKCARCGLGEGVHVYECKNDPSYCAEAVDHPSHYTQGKIEIIDIIEDIIASYDPVIGWSIGQVIKYCARAPHKINQLEDLKKAKWYLERAIGATEAPLSDRESD